MSARDSSVDDADVARFDRIGAQWWDPRGPMRALHKMNPLRVSWLCESIEKQLLRAPGSKIGSAHDLAGVNILDIGCGAGLLSEALARYGARVTGIDPSAQNIEIARKHADTAKLAIDYRATTAQALSGTGVVFDVVCAMEVIEHVANLDAFMSAAGSLVRPGGLFFASTLNRTFKSFALAIIGAEYVLRWAPKGTHQWEKFITPEELEEALEKCGLDPFARSGVVYDPFGDRWRKSRDMAVNYMMAAQREA